MSVFSFALGFVVFCFFRLQQKFFFYSSVYFFDFPATILIVNFKFRKTFLCAPLYKNVTLWRASLYLPEEISTTNKSCKKMISKIKKQYFFSFFIMENVVDSLGNKEVLPIFLIFNKSPSANIN